MLWLGGRRRGENSDLAQLQLTVCQVPRSLGRGEVLAVELRTPEAPAESGVSVQQILAGTLRRLRLTASEDWSCEDHRVVRAHDYSQSLVCGVGLCPNWLRTAILNTELVCQSRQWEDSPVKWRPSQLWRMRGEVLIRLGLKTANTVESAALLPGQSVPTGQS